MKKEIEMAKDIVVIQENEYNEILRQSVAVIENSRFQHNCINSILQKYLRTREPANPRSRYGVTSSIN